VRVLKTFLGVSALLLIGAGSAYFRSCLISDGHAKRVFAAHALEGTLKKNISGETPPQRYILNASESKFFAHALSGGLLWFKGHNHLIAVREFTGEAQLTPNSITPASLNITAKAASMVETSDVFTEAQKQIINKELREIVLHPDQYPDIILKSTNVTGKATAANHYDLKITGDLTLHGVTRSITIPTQVTVAGSDLRARGEFSIDRSDFKVKATSAMHGLIRVKNRVKFTFDIVGHQR
jgi:polyisoprenoid-binding protein YceI